MQGARGIVVQVCLAAVMLLGIGASAADGSELTRDEYVERAEKVCKQSFERASPILSQAKRNLKKNAVKVSGRQFLRAAKIIKPSGERLAAIPEPARDAVALEEWQEHLSEENDLLEKIGKELIAERRVKAQGYLARFVQTGNRANRAVTGFGFNHCLFKASRVF